MRGRKLWLLLLAFLAAFLCQGRPPGPWSRRNWKRSSWNNMIMARSTRLWRNCSRRSGWISGRRWGRCCRGTWLSPPAFSTGWCMTSFFYALGSCRENLGHILLIAVIAAVFSNFSGVFQSRQISEISFYLLYLLLVALCLNSFQAVLDWVGEGVEALTTFMGAFCPVYFLAVAVAKGSVTAVAFYNLVLFLIYLAQMVIAGFLLPVIHIYFIVQVLNFLSREDYLSKLAGVLHMGVAWALKTVLACVVGLNVIQGLISPAVDSVKRSVLTRGVEAIPGVGDAIGGVTEVALGTAVLVKNGIGVTGAVICVALCVVPLVQIGCIALLYKLAAALIQPVSDQRVAGCIESVGDGCRLLMRVVFTTGLLFLLTIVVAAALTSL